MIENVKITFKGKKNLNISNNETKECYFYNIKPHKSSNTLVNHHILLIDISQSMYNEIELLKEKLLLTLDALCKSKNNFVSIIAYSGHDECYRLANGVQCNKTSYSVSQIYKIIDEDLYVRGVTVISDPFEQAIDIVKSLMSVCNKHNIILFTDGCVVPLKWSTNEEINRCINCANFCKENSIFFNAIGFGKYYDREFLNTLSHQVNNGTFMHLNEIDDFYECVLEIIENVNKSSNIKINILNDDYFIINESRRIQSSSPTIVDIRKGISIVSLDKPLEIEGNTIPERKTIAPDGLINDFMYSLTLYHILNNDIDNGEYTITQTGDINMYNLVSNCFSFLEKGAIIQSLKKCISNKKLRYINGREIIKPYSLEDEPLCLLEILYKIIDDSNSKLLWDFKTPYKRIGMKNSYLDDRFKFIYDRTGYGNVIDLSIGSKKLNIGLKVQIDGEIQDKLSKLKLGGKIYKDYNLVLNGNINSPTLSCILSRRLKMYLKKQGLLIKTIKHNNTPICILDLTKLKVTNRRILRSLSQQEVIETLYDIEILSCKQWALNKLINNLLVESNLSKLDLNSENMPVEELEARKLFRVSKEGTFTPLTNKSMDDTPYEIYKAKVLEWKIDKFPRTSIKEIALNNYRVKITDDPIESLKYLSNELSKIKKEKFLKTLKVNLVRISSGISEKCIFLWDTEIQKSKIETDKILKKNMIENGIVTINTKTINDITLRQDSYTVFTKCS